MAEAKRFYREARPEAGDGGYVLTLDGRPARTPARSPLTLPTLPLAEAVAAEWAGQGDAIVPAAMPLTRLANSAIDGVSREVDAVRADIARYAGSDLVVYRAGTPERLVAEQSAAWDPVLDWARRELGTRFILREGVTFLEQPAPSMECIRERLAAETSPFRLAGLHVMTTLTGSALIALMTASAGMEPEAAWAAAHVDELFQEAQWGADAEAVERRERRAAEFRAAARFVQLARN